MQKSEVTRSLRSELYDRYYGLDPQQYAPVDQLVWFSKKMSNMWTRKDVLIKANLHLELWQHPENTAGHRSRHGREGVELLRMQQNHQSLISLMEGGLLLTHAPIFKYGWNDAARAESYRNMVRLLNTFQQVILAPDAAYGSEKGMSYEVLTILGIAHTGLQGMLAQPSLERQDRNNVPVDEKVYKWDVTAYSDGSLLDPGEYRVQVKSDSDFRGHYHPDIALTTGTRTMGIANAEPYQIFELSREIAATILSGRPTSGVLSLQDSLLRDLDAAGPAAHFA